jgi:1-acyl-sn-glycerol-3-phosphate acyltransferase
LAKSSLWNIPLMGAIMRSGKHIPVFRGLTRPGDTYRDAVASVNSGECVVVFPEATFSNREDLWPMRGKTGVARIALASGVPVIPVANWGTHRLLPTKSLLPRIFPRTTVDLLAGPAVDLSDLACDDPSREVLELATARIMAAITALLGELRREEPPA